jgi:hypothetical protein
VGVSGRGGACLGVREFLFKGRAVIANDSISQVRPKDKMATDLQNGDIIVLSIMMLPSNCGGSVFPLSLKKLKDWRPGSSTTEKVFIAKRQ